MGLVTKKEANKTTTTTATIGSAIAFIGIATAGYFGVDMDPATASGLTGALAFVINFFVKVKK